MTVGASDAYKIQIAVHTLTGNMTIRSFSETKWCEWVTISMN